jgi:hypothetical protein
VAQDLVQWRALVNTAVGLRVPYNFRKFFSNSTNCCLSRTAPWSQSASVVNSLVTIISFPIDFFYIVPVAAIFYWSRPAHRCSALNCFS